MEKPRRLFKALSLTACLAFMLGLVVLYARPQLAFPLLNRFSSALRLHVQGDALSIAWSHDGRLLATSSYYFSRITIWDAATGSAAQELNRNVVMEGHSLAFTPDDRQLVTSTARRIGEDKDVSASIWDVASGKVLRDIAGPNPHQGLNENSAEEFALDPRGRLLAIAYHDSLIRVGIYDMSTLTLLQVLPEPESGATTVAFSPNGQSLAIGTARGAIVVYDTANWSVGRTINAYGSGSPISVLVFSPDSQRVASVPYFGARSETNELRIWDVATGALTTSFHFQPDSGGNPFVARGLAWSPDGIHLASATDDRVIRLWNTKAPLTPTVVHTFTHTAWSVAFSPDGKRLAATGNDEVIVVPVAP